ncbi:hypothetical protein J2Y67_004697 [Neobacillus niacini]|nr:hypothetical protein [Neobacillus niacini]
MTITVSIVNGLKKGEKLIDVLKSNLILILLTLYFIVTDYLQYF